MKYRCAQYDDVDSIMAIVRDAQRTLRELGVEQWQNGYPSDEVIRGDIARGVGRVIESDGVVAAYAANIAGVEPAYLQLAQEHWLSSKPYVTVHRLCVAQDRLRHGVATLMLSHIRAEATDAGCASIRIDTHPDNARMRTWICRNGFRYCGDVCYDSGLRLAFERLISAD